MRKVKWIFFGYLALVALIVLTISFSFAFTTDRDPLTLYTTYGSNIRTLDPGKIADTTSSGVAGNIFECLYNYDYDARPYKLIPELAAGLPQISEDGLTLTIPIKKGIHYYDPDKTIFPEGTGREVKAADFIYAWKRIADFHLDSQNYAAMFEGRIAGIDEWWTYTKDTEPDKIDWDRPVKGFEAVDDYTIRIHLTKPDPQLRYNLAHLPTAPIVREAVDRYGEQFKYKPVGTGPYVLKEHRPEERIVFEANPVYRGRPDAEANANLPADQKLPRVKRLRLDYFEEDLPAWALFQQGLIDISGIPKDTFGQAIDNRTRDLTPDMRAKGIKLIKHVSPTIWYYGFNMEDPVVGKNKPLRQAMSMAFNRQDYIDLMLNGRGFPAVGPIPPGFATYDEKAVNPYTRFDLDGARERMREAERIQGGKIPTITFLLPGQDTTFRQYGEYMKKQMEQIGLDLRIEYRTWARFQEMVDAKQAQFYALGWVADYPDEQTFLQLFYGKNVSPGPNSANYVNPEYDKLYERAAVMNPSPERDELYKQMTRIVQEDCPWLLNCYGVSYTLYYDWVEDFKPNEYAHGVVANRVINFDRRQEMQRKR